MKHKRNVMSIVMATIMLVSLCAVVSTTSVSAATSVSANAKNSAPASTSVSASQSSGANAHTSAGLLGAPAGVVGAPAVCSQGAHSLDMFVRGTDNAIWWRHDTWGTWGAWKSLGGLVTSSPAAASWAFGTLAVFARGTNGQLYERQTLDGGTNWGSWFSRGGQILAGTGPAAYGVNSPMTLGWFVTGTNHQLYHAWDDEGGQHVWRSLGGYLTSSPGAALLAQTGVGHFFGIVVAARGSNGNLYYKMTNDGGATWSGWTNLGGQILAGTGPAIVYIDPANGIIKFFVTGTNHQLYWLSSSPDGNYWASLGGYLTSSPAAASHSTNAIDVFALGRNGALYSRLTDDGGTSWSPWYQVTL